MPEQSTIHDARLEQKRTERQQQQAGDTPSEKRKVVMDGAILKCPYASGPGKLVVDSNEIKLQDQLWATEADNKNMHNLQFEGTCGHPKFSGQTPPPCKSVINVKNWKDCGTTLVQDQTVLIKQSCIECDPVPNTITPNSIAPASGTQNNTNSIPQIVEVYFAKQIKSNDGKGVSLERVSERGLSYSVALVIKTNNLPGKNLQVKFKSGKSNVLTEVDTEIEFIDIEKKIKTSDFSVTVDNYTRNTKLNNAADFKDMAVLHIMLNQKTENLSFDLAKKIMGHEDQEACIYVEVTCQESNVVFLGGQGQEGSTNKYMNGEGSFFKIKYLEQAWIKTAREEMEKGVSEATHCSYIADNYHNINRQYKPTGCATIKNAWCASFAGWCLKQNQYSAQCDPGAYTYGHINTRYRAGYRKNPGDAPLTNEIFDEPVWARAASVNNSLGSICVVKSGKHVTFAVAKTEDGKVLYLGGNQGDRVNISPFSGHESSVYPIEYAEREIDKELPVYYAEIQEASAT